MGFFFFLVFLIWVVFIGWFSSLVSLSWLLGLCCGFVFGIWAFGVLVFDESLVGLEKLLGSDWAYIYD